MNDPVMTFMTGVILLFGLFSCGLLAGLFLFPVALRAIRFQYRFIVTPEILANCIYPADLSPSLVGLYAFYGGRPFPNDIVLIEFRGAEKTKRPTRALIPLASLPPNVRYALEKDGVIERT